MNHELIIFDLDGTITNPKKGIINSVVYALKKLGIEKKFGDIPIQFIGPPLHESFQIHFGFNENQAWKAVEYYRERYATKGIEETKLFEGFDQLLQSLKQRGVLLAVGTSKPAVFAEKVLKKCGISKYFDLIVGAELDGRRSDKSEIIQTILEKFSGVNRRNVIMIGDRKYDVIGAQKNQIDTVGVTFGYGSVRELREAGSTYVIDSIQGLSTFFKEKGVFDDWNRQKKELQTKTSELYINPREIWFTEMGKNVGFEQDGKKEFKRPVLVIKKVGNLFFTVALTSNGKTNSRFYHKFKTASFNENNQTHKESSYAILSQVKVVDKKRFTEKMGSIKRNEFETIKQKLKALLL